MAIAGVVRDVTVRRPRRRLAIVRARIHDDSGDIPAIWFNQEWLATKLVPGTPIRLRGRLQRGEFQVRAYDLGDALATADYAPVYPAGEELTPQRLRALVDQALPLRRRRARSAPGRARPTPRAADQGRRPSCDASAAVARRGGCGKTAARARGAACAPGRPRPPAARARGRRRAGAAAAGRARPGAAGRAAVPPDRRPGADDRASSTATSGVRCRWSASYRATSARGRLSSRCTHCCELSRRASAGRSMAPTETLAEQHFLTLESFCTQARGHVWPADELGWQAGSRAGGRRGGRRRHPCTHPGGRRSGPARRRGRRRAASVRRRAAQGALVGNRGRTRST